MFEPLPVACFALIRFAVIMRRRKGVTQVEFKVWRNGLARKGDNGIGVRPYSGAASTECAETSDFIAVDRVPTLLRPGTGALRRGDRPPSQTHYSLAVAAMREMRRAFNSLAGL